MALINKSQLALLHLDKAFEQIPLNALQYNQISVREAKYTIFCYVFLLKVVC